MPFKARSFVLLTLLAVFFFNTSAFGAVLSVQLYFHQQLQLEKIKNKKHKDINELRISRNLVESQNEKFQWEKNWEFRWMGEMYDIEDSYTDGDVWVFHVKHDTREDMLRKKMERNAQDETNARDTQSKKNLKCGSEYFESYEYTTYLRSSLCDPVQEMKSVVMKAHNALPDPPPWFI
jgi:hypothetical protein